MPCITGKRAKIAAASLTDASPVRLQLRPGTTGLVAFIMQRRAESPETAIKVGSTTSPAWPRSGYPPN